MENVFLFLAGIAVGAMLLISFKLLRDYWQYASARLFILIMIGSVCHTMHPLIQGPDWLELSLQIVSSSVPGLFWLFTLSFFSVKEQGEGVTPTHLLVFAVNIAISTTLCLQPEQSGQLTSLSYLDFVFTSTLVTLGIWEVIKNWPVDLVECRRKMRGVLLVITGLLLLFALYNQLIYGADALPLHIAYTNAVSLSVLTLLFAYWILVVDEHDLVEVIDDSPLDEQAHQRLDNDEGLSAADQNWLNALKQCMEQEAYYRNNDLTIRSLSEHLNIPEHHLRRLINRQLGYRNFNEYLNRFRVSEATNKLSDPNLARLPITTIAIDSGFASLTTFNKTFKALKDMTPTEFRRLHGEFSGN